MASENVAILQRNGEDMVCPFVPPLQIRQRVQNALGQVGEQISIQKSSCNTNCPLFDLSRIGANYVSVKCSGVELEYKIEDTIAFENPNKDESDNIISLDR